MTRIGLIVFLIMLGVGVCAGQNKARAWKEFVSQDFKFQTLFPGVPKSSVDKLDAEPGPRTAHWFTVDWPQQFFGVSVTDYPDGPLLLKESELKIDYDNLRDGAVATPGFKLISERDVWLGKQFGREIVVTDGREIIKNRMFLVEHRLFQTVASIKSPLFKNKRAQRDMDKFLAAFQISADQGKSSVPR
jgi:hypothetical protein